MRYQTDLPQNRGSDVPARVHGIFDRGLCVTAPMKTIPLLFALAVLAGCSSDPGPAPGRQEREMGAGQLGNASAGNPVDTAYVARIMGESGFDYRRCGSMAPAGTAGGDARQRQQCDRAALAREDDTIRRRITEDQRTGQINAATAQAALALQRSRVQQALQTPGQPALAVPGGNNGSGDSASGSASSGSTPGGNGPGGAPGNGIGAGAGTGGSGGGGGG